MTTTSAFGKPIASLELSADFLSRPVSANFHFQPPAALCLLPDGARGATITDGSGYVFHDVVLTAPLKNC